MHNELIPYFSTEGSKLRKKLISLPACLVTKENQKKRKIKDMRRPREIKGQRVGKGEEEGGYKSLPNHCKPSEEIMLG